MAGSINGGRQKVMTARMEMQGLQSLVDEYSTGKPLAGVHMLTCVTPTPETGVFLLTLQQLGATIAACSDNAFAADDDVVAYLQESGVSIFAKSHMSQDEYFDSMSKAITQVRDSRILHIADDGCDITSYIAEHHPELFARTKLITEQTTCGINALRHHYHSRRIQAPAININDCFSKRWFDNYIGIQQSLVHGLTTAGVSIPGRRVAMFGYGAVAKGAIQSLTSQGAHLSVVEGDILKLMQADMDGYQPVSAKEALSSSELCLTATGCIGTISGEMIEKYAGDGLILGNIGHGTQEYDVNYLETHARKTQLNPYIDEFTLKDGRKIYSLCKGALVNFLAGGGNMPRIMGLTFTLTILAHLRAARTSRQEVGLHALSRDIEEECAKRSFPYLADLVYDLSDSQKHYLDAGYVPQE